MGTFNRLSPQCMRGQPELWATKWVCPPPPKARTAAHTCSFSLDARKCRVTVQGVCNARREQCARRSIHPLQLLCLWPCKQQVVVALPADGLLHPCGGMREPIDQQVQFHGACNRQAVTPAMQWALQRETRQVLRPITIIHPIQSSIFEPVMLTLYPTRSSEVVGSRHPRPSEESSATLVQPKANMISINIRCIGPLNNPS